jgi:hypothetical protein
MQKLEGLWLKTSLEKKANDTLTQPIKAVMLISSEAFAKA